LRFSSFPVRPPPPSTLFPYTTLFRSALTGGDVGDDRDRLRLRLARARHLLGSALPLLPSLALLRRTLHVQAEDPGRSAAHDDLRSEEHTSELQSRFDLVCRLLLEKKK